MPNKSVKISCIYKIANSINGKFYIGSTKNFRSRKASHLNKLRKNKHDNIHLQRSWNKHGENSFEFCIVEETNNLFVREQYYLDTLKPAFNIGLQACGGDNLTKHPRRMAIIRKITKSIVRRMKNRTPEERLALSEKMMGKNNPNYGNKWSTALRKKVGKIVKERYKKYGTSQEVRDKMSSAQKRIWANPEYKARISKNREGNGNHFYGKRHSKDSKQRMRQVQRDKFLNSTPEERAKVNPQIRKVEINGLTYFGVSEAARQLGVCPATIVFRIKSKNKKFANYFYKD